MCQPQRPAGYRSPSVHWWEMPRFPERETTGGSTWAAEAEKGPKEVKDKGRLQSRGLGRKGRAPARAPGYLPLQLYKEGVMH